jgi:subtilase family serine protease
MLSTSGAAPWSGAILRGSQPVVFHPAWSDVEFVSFGEIPPTQGQCAAINRRCFNPQAEQTSYNLTPLLKKGHQGQGETIIIVDSFGSETIRHDLKVFNNAFGLPHLCGEENTPAGCTGPTFSELQQGNTSTNPLPGLNTTGLENRAAWALEVSLDVEWAHSMAPLANILLVTTPTAEVLGVQGFPDFFKAEEDVINAHLGSVISQSFAAAEETFNQGTAALLHLRHAFEAAQANQVTVFASSGDSGTANVQDAGEDSHADPLPDRTVACVRPDRDGGGWNVRVHERHHRGGGRQRLAALELQGDPGRP